MNLVASAEDRYYRDHPSLKHNLSFAGCGFLGLYHVGVCCCIKRFAPHLYQNKPISGTSAGAIAAACLVCDVNMADCVQYMCQLIANARQYTLGPFDPRFKISEHLKEGLSRLLPSDAHMLCSGRLSISLTCYATRKNIVVQQFKDREELITAILCSAYIPIFSGFVPLAFRGQLVVDGGLSDNLLCLDRSTIKVSPFAGDADICPLETAWGPHYHMTPPQRYEDILGTITFLNNTIRVNLTNIKRLVCMVWPMSPSELFHLASQGYDDALRFLSTRGFIACRIHQTPRAFSNVVRNKRDSVSSRRRFPRTHRSASVSQCVFTLPPDEINVQSCSTTESFLESILTKPSIPKAALCGSGVGLNVAKCISCQNQLRRALNSSLPKFLRSIIKGNQKPIPSCPIRLCNYGYNLARRSLQLFGPYAYSLGHHMVTSSLLLQLDCIIYLTLKSIMFMKRLSIEPHHLVSLLDLFTKSRLYLLNLKSDPPIEYTWTESSSIHTESDHSTFSSVLSPPLAIPRHNQPKCASFTSLYSLWKATTVNLVDGLLGMDTIHMPTTNDCGFELLSSPTFPVHSEDARTVD